MERSRIVFHIWKSCIRTWVKKYYVCTKIDVGSIRNFDKGSYFCTKFCRNISTWYITEVDGRKLMCSSCHIRRLTKHWNSRRTWNICFIFNFQLKKIRSKIIQITFIELWSFISFELRHVNSMKMSQKAKFGFSIFQLKIKWKQIFQVRHQFGHFVKCQIWHELRKSK